MTTDARTDATLDRTPRLVATVGLHGSASTWVFNVVRELMVAGLGAERVLAVYGEDVPHLLAEHAPAGRHLVLKSHHGGAGWDALMWLTRAPMFLSIRDPRDAAVSLAQRFNIPLSDAAQGIAQDCARLARCADAGHPVYRYEDRFFEDSGLPGRIAAALGLSIDAAVQQAIFARYTTAAVRAFGARFAELPGDRVVSNAQVTVDRVTQIHRTHIGDGQVGKWRRLVSAPDAAQLTRFYAGFLARFDYPE